MQFSERTDGANFSVVRINKPINMGRKMGAIKREIEQLPDRIGRMMKAHVMMNFVAEGFIDGDVKRWPKKKRSNGKPILVDTQRMKRSIRVTRSGNRVSITTPVKYAGIHNRPVGEVKQYNGKNYPGRKFMGISKTLTSGIHKMVTTRLNIAARA